MNDLLLVIKQYIFCANTIIKNIEKPPIIEAENPKDPEIAYSNLKIKQNKG